MILQGIILEWCLYQILPLGMRMANVPTVIYDERFYFCGAVKSVFLDIDYPSCAVAAGDFAIERDE